LRLKTFGHGAVESLGHLAADEQQAAMLLQFKAHAVAAGGSVDRCGIVADDVSWGHRVSPDCGPTVSGDITASQSIIPAVQRKKIYCKATARQCQNGAR
jgi:hypothetical protein